MRNKIETKKHITLLGEALADSSYNTVGILFISNITDSHKTIYSVDTSWHSPIRYYMAPVGSAVNNIAVSDLVNFIQGGEAQEVFRAAGFNLGTQ